MHQELNCLRVYVSRTSDTFTTCLSSKAHSLFISLHATLIETKRGGAHADNRILSQSLSLSHTLADKHTHSHEVH